MKRKLTSILLAIAVCCLSILPAAAANHHWRRSRHHRSHYVMRRNHTGKSGKVMSIAAPIAIEAAFGPAGSIGYQGFKHRRFIEHHLGGHRRGYKRHVAGHHRG
jgi:hypothetical protein